MYLIVDLASMQSSASAPNEVINADVQEDKLQFTWRTGRGKWVHAYMQRMERYAIGLEPRGFERPSGFFNAVSTATFSYIQPRRAQDLLIRFTNRYYRKWKELAVVVPDYEKLRLDPVHRKYCYDCAEGWSCPLSRSVKENQNRHFTCARDCDEFDGLINQSIDRDLTIDLILLDQMWSDFQREDSGGHLPEWKPVWLNPRRSHEDVEAYKIGMGSSKQHVSPIAPQPVTEAL